jgi:hypothetical protein
MQYKILVSFKGSPDGRHAVDYAAGETVELTDSLAEVALSEKWAEPIAAAGESAEKPARAKKPKVAEAE